MTDYNASDRRAIRQAKKLAKQEERQRHEIMRGIMSIRAGRQWMHDLLSSCHVFATTFNGDALRSAFAEGERNIGLRLLNDVMGATPDQYVVMMREEDERRQQRPSTDGTEAEYDPLVGADPSEPDGTEDDGDGTEAPVIPVRSS